MEQYNQKVQPHCPFHFSVLFFYSLPEIAKLVLDRLHVEMMRLFEGVRLDTTDKMRVLGPEASHQGYYGDIKLSARGGRTP